VTFGLAAALLFAIEVRAAGDCPAAADVERQLLPLLGDGEGAHVADVATIERRGDGSVTVSLADPGGQPIGDRKFPRARTCGEQAKTVAVTLAIWEAQLHPEIALRLDRLSPEAPPPEAPPPVPAVAIARPAPPLEAPQSEVSLGMALLGDVQSGGWAPGARVELGLGPAGARWRARLAGVGLGRHTIDVAPGQATWWRTFAQLGVDVDVARGRRWAAVVGAGGVAGLVSITGEGFAENKTARSVDVGAEGRLRLECRPGRVRPWLGGAVIGWLRRQDLDLEGGSSDASLPRVTPVAALGADFVW
jgi:hypothetical protein